MPWNTRFAQRTAAMQRSPIREILKLTAQPNVISFAGGLPAPEFFPQVQLKEAAETVLSERGREALQYSPTEGLLELRQFLVERYQRLGVPLTLDHLIITTGSQQGLDLLGRVLLEAGDGVVVENPTYLGMILAWRPYGIRFLAHLTDQDGLCVETLAPVLAQQPKILYSVPTFQNPSGVTLSLERRQALIDLLAAHQVPGVEDDAYGDLRYNGPRLPTLLELDAGRGNVVYLGTFSKTLAPGLRVGWMIAPPALLEKIIQTKQATDLHTSTLNQLMAYAAVKDGFWEGHIQRLQDQYRQRRDTMLSALERYFPSECTWASPDGGLFIMVHLPQQINSLELLAQAVRHEVAFIPGADFFLAGMGQNTMRLNFSNALPDHIEEGIQRLGLLIKQQLH